MPDDLPELLTVDEVAALLRLNQMTLRNWIDAGTFPHIRLGRRVRIRREDYMAFAGAQGAADGDDLLTIAEVAELFRLNPQTLRNWIKAGTLPAVRVGERRVRVRRADVEALMVTRPPPPPQPGRSKTRALPPRISGTGSCSHSEPRTAGSQWPRSRASRP